MQGVLESLANNYACFIYGFSIGEKKGSLKTKSNSQNEVDGKDDRRKIREESLLRQ